MGCAKDAVVFGPIGGKTQEQKSAKTNRREQRK